MPDRSRAPRVMFTGGGTLGHLMPGLCVLEEMQRRWPRADFAFVASRNRWDGDFLRRQGVTVWTLSPPPTAGRAWAAPGFVTRSSSNLLKAMGMLRRFRPHVVIGLGGFASVPIALGAALTALPTVLLEQNVVPGKANRFLSRWADCVCASWPGTEARLTHARKVQITGNPIRRSIATRRGDTAALWGLDPQRRTILVMGGSRGAVAVNDAVLAALTALAPLRDAIQVLHATGPISFEKVQRAYWQHRVKARVCPFIDDMASAYAAADLVVCRAGGSTLAELGAAGKPAILVPYPYAAERHQDANAAVFAAAGAAVVMQQEALTGASLARLIAALATNEERLARMAVASTALSRPFATDAVVDEIVTHMRRRRQAPGTGDNALTAAEDAKAWGVDQA